MGAIFGSVYLSPEPLALDDIVAQVGVTKGAVIRYCSQEGEAR